MAVKGAGLTEGTAEKLLSGTGWAVAQLLRQAVIPTGEKKDQQPARFAEEEFWMKRLLKMAWQNGELCRITWE